ARRHRATARDVVARRRRVRRLLPPRQWWCRAAARPRALRLDHLGSAQGIVPAVRDRLSAGARTRAAAACTRQRRRLLAGRRRRGRPGELRGSLARAVARLPRSAAVAATAPAWA